MRRRTRPLPAPEWSQVRRSPGVPTTRPRRDWRRRRSVLSRDPSEAVYYRRIATRADRKTPAATKGQLRNMKVLVAGGAGQLAGAIVDEFSADSEVLALSHGEMDITDPANVRDRLAAYRPDVLVNCAAYNDVDGAEEHALEALTANAFGVRVLARAASAAGTTFVHYSSDFVFDGRSERPYVEED